LNITTYNNTYPGGTKERLFERVKEMKKLIEKIKAKFRRKPLLVIPYVSGSCEQPQDNNGDLVPLVWMIEKLRRREGGCTMNELLEEAKRNFKGIEQIKHRTINYR